MVLFCLSQTRAEAILDSWNLEFDREPIRFQGRTLPPETIYHSKDIKVLSDLYISDFHLSCLFLCVLLLFLDVSLTLGMHAQQGLL